MTNQEAIVHIKDVICENNAIKPNMVVFEQEKEALYMAIEALEKQKIGHWIETDMDIYECSEYHKGLALLEKENYCPHCGAKMEGE